MTAIGIGISPVFGSAAGAGGAAVPAWHEIAAPTWYIEADQGDMLQAPGGAAVAADGDPVGFVPHHYISGGDFRQTTAAAKLTYKTGILNGHPVLRLDGADYLIDSTTLHLITDTSGLFVFVGARGNTGALQTYVASADTASSNRFFILRSQATSNRLAITRWNADTLTTAEGGTSTNTNYHIYEWQSNGTAYTIRIDGVDETLSGTNNGDWLGDTDARDNMTIGALRYTTTELVQFLTGDVAVVAYYSNPADFTAEARQALIDKYGLPF